MKGSAASGVHPNSGSGQDATAKSADRLDRRLRSTGGETPCSQCPLRERPCFTQASTAEIALIQQMKRGEITRPAGGMVIEEGQRDAGLFTLLDGWAMRFKTLPDGRRQLLTIALPGDFLGLQQRVDAESDHGVMALTPVRLCVFERDLLGTLHAQAPSLSYDITWISARETSLVDDNLLTAGRRNAPERLAALIVSTWLRARAVMPDVVDADGSLFWPLTQQLMADAVGLSLVHTHRTLRQLVQAGLVHWGVNQRLHVPDLGRLAKAARMPWPMDTAMRPLI